ncbi:uncharacterized protein JCM10292_006901 [Rhodotorula paludigena]|uniref:uncharacterized protein n=1 Tax=Rhodotorula paludigena TaxID=86838 RepID=UPI00317B05B3
MSGFALPINAPYDQPSPLTAPRAQPPPSTIPTERLASTADAWARGSTASPHPPPSMTSLQPNSFPQPPLPPMPPQPPAGSYPGAPYGGAPGYEGVGGPSNPGSGHPARPVSYSMGGPPPNGYQSPAGSMHGRPASYAAPPSGPYGAMPPPPPPGSGYYPGQPPLPPMPPQMNGGYLSPAPPSMMGSPAPSMQNGFPPRVASMQSADFAALQNGFDGLSLGSATPAPGGYATGTNGRPNYYANPEDGPPHKLSVTPPDQKMLASMRETANAYGGDPQRRVAWAKQVLKFIERHQAAAGESSRITDPVLVSWTDEALKHILASASSANPVPLALYLRGDLSASGSFPSYRSKDAKSSFRDFEAAANAGYVKAWFRIGRAYEDFGDIRRAVGAYEKGVEKGDCGSTYRLAMAYLLGQIGVQADVPKALGLLKRAADSADLDTPQPPYILGMLLSGEFDSPSMQLNKSLVPIDMDEAKWRIERAAYLCFGPAQYKMGFAYEYATLGCLFEPLLSVQYYALASQNGEVEADMALSKWYLCGSEGNFDKNESLAVTFAEKAAARQLPSAEFARGYFYEVGINGPIDLEKAKRWYSRAAGHGNDDAKQRLAALEQSNPTMLNRTDHEAHVNQKLVRKRTAAKIRSEEQRERLAANKIAASISSGPMNGARPPSGYPHRQDSASSYPSSTHRRRNTLKQVEAAAMMGPPPPGTPNPLRQSQQRYPSPAPGGRPQGYQLTDAPAPSSSARPSGSVRPQAIQVAQDKPATFAEMGIATQKAKKDDCVVM